MNDFYKNANGFPKIMGILNITPDSFSDGGNFYDKNQAFEHALKIMELGVDILDVGGESSRPGAPAVSEQEELDRVIPVIEMIRKYNKSIPISIDTTKFKVAEYALKSGANIINDISGLTATPALAKLSANFNAWLVIMHIKGNPLNMQINPQYKNIVKDVYEFFSRQINLAMVNEQKNIILDVGIGFGKTYEHNIELLKSLNHFDSLKYPKLLGISRKSFIGKMVDIEEPTHRDVATFLIHSLLLKKDIDIIRVHNVDLAMQMKYVYGELGDLVRN